MFDFTLIEYSFTPPTINKEPKNTNYVLEVKHCKRLYVHEKSVFRHIFFIYQNSLYSWVNRRPADRVGGTGYLQKTHKL